MKIILMLALLVFGGTAVNGYSASKHVHVYSLTQHYWDVRPNDTLAGIAAALLPEDIGHRRALMQDILELNPGAFINGDPARLRANKRLWLPNTLQQPLQQHSSRGVKVENYSWGSVKRATD